MGNSFNCPDCGCEFAITVTKHSKTIQQTSLDDTMLIAKVCSEKIQQLVKKKDAKGAQQLIKALKTLLTDVISLPAGVSEGIINELERMGKQKKGRK